RHVEEALERLTEAYLALGVASEAQTAAAVLGHNFPDSRWYADAYRLVRSRGFEPSEDKGSWISRAFGSWPSFRGGATAAKPSTSPAPTSPRPAPPANPAPAASAPPPAAPVPPPPGPTSLNSANTRG